MVLTVSVSVSDTVTLNTCPHYFMSGTNLGEKGTARDPLSTALFLFTGISLSENWGTCRAEDTGLVRVPGHARLPGTQCRNRELKISI